jgi:hypothetical protein
MDYSHSNFFQGGPPYQFMGAHVAPLTPSHSNSVASDDFNTTSPPVGCVPSIPSRDMEARERERDREKDRLADRQTERHLALYRYFSLDRQSHAASVLVPLFG